MLDIRAPSCPLHCLCCCVECRRNGFGGGLVQRTPPEAKPQRKLQVLHPAQHLGRHRATGSGFAGAGQQGLDRRAIGGKESLTLARDPVALAAGGFGFSGRVTHVLKPGEGRVDDARAGAVAAAHTIFDRLHELVAVARLLGDHGEGEQAKLAIVEQPVAAATTEPAPVVTMVMLPVTAIRQVLGVSEPTV